MFGKPSISHGARWALRGARLGIDHVDDAMIVLLAARRKLVSALGPVKRAVQAPVRDTAREEQVHERARRLARRLRVPPASADSLIGALVADACHQQSTGAPRSGGGAEASHMRVRHALLRLIPPPRYWRAPLALTPQPLRDALAERVLSKALGESLKDDAMTAIAERRVGIQVTDLGLAWVLEVRDGALHRTQGVAEAVVHATATDLLLLSSRLEDADTLFFQRRLKLTGDVELGLTVRNLLDRMPWETLPLGVRVVLHRAARLLRAARDVAQTAQPSGEYR